MQACVAPASPCAQVLRPSAWRETRMPPPAASPRLPQPPSHVWACNAHSVGAAALTSRPPGQLLAPRQGAQPAPPPTPAAPMPSPPGCSHQRAQRALTCPYM